MSGPTVLIVDDERTLARSIKTFLTESGYEAEVAGDAEKALQLLDSFRPDVIFADVRLPGMGGIELLQRIRENLAALRPRPVGPLLVVQPAGQDLVQHARMLTHIEGG